MSNRVPKPERKAEYLLDPNWLLKIAQGSEHGNSHACVSLLSWAHIQDPNLVGLIAEDPVQVPEAALNALGCWEQQRLLCVGCGDASSLVELEEEELRGDGCSSTSVRRSRGRGADMGSFEGEVLIVAAHVLGIGALQ